MAFVNYENKRGSGKKLKVHFDLPDDDDYPNSAQRNSTTSPSNSSDSSLDSDDTEKDSSSIDNVNQSKFDGNNVYGSPVWSFQGGSVTQSPPIQMMSPLGYDPNRIPSSVFAKSPTPVEWSVASNESLFSLHLGNNSFSTDLAFVFNNKSGELARTSDFGGIPMPMPLPPVQEVNHDKRVEMVRHSVSSDSSPGEETAVVQLGVKDDHKNAVETSAQVEITVLDKTPEEDHSKEAVVVPREEAKNYASVSYRSMASDISTRSFQFPILTADGRSSSANGGRISSSTGGRTSSSTVESEKQGKAENHHQEEKPLNPPTPEAKTTRKAEKAPKKGGGSWCCCFRCSPCY